MPFTHPLLAVAAGSAFDCLIETTGTYVASSGSSGQIRSYSANGGFNVISDTKNIAIQVFESSTRDSVQLTDQGTLKITVIENYSYSGFTSGDRAGLASVNLAPDGDYSIGAFVSDHVTFTSSATQTVEDETFDNSAGRPGLVFHIRKNQAGGTFQTSGRLLIGINKT